jgi:hypothetical protein
VLIFAMVTRHSLSATQGRPVSASNRLPLYRRP